MNNYLRNRYVMMVVVLALAVASLACRIGISKPFTQIKTGPEQTVDVRLPLPDDASNDVELTLEFVAGELVLAPGASEYLASGTAIFNVPDFEPKVETSGSSYTLSVGTGVIEGIPVTDDMVRNKWDLQLADTPMSLAVKAGAYDCRFELGGLALEKLAFSDGGANVKGAFSEPNLVEMSVLSYNTGASDVELTGLANANFSQMTFDGGAGEYTLSFDGDLQRDTAVEIDAGMAEVTVIVPEGVNAQVSMDGALTTVKTSGGWENAGSGYVLDGSGPTINITVEMGAGTLVLKSE
jgi:hypothetical protein